MEKNEDGVINLPDYEEIIARIKEKGIDPDSVPNLSNDDFTSLIKEVIPELQ